MKKCILLAMPLFLGISALCQTQLGFFAGAQRTWFRYTVADEKQETQPKNAVQGGIILKIPFENQLYFSPSLYYSGKGYQVTLKNPSVLPDEHAVSNNVQVSLIELAPLLQVDFSPKPSHWFVRFGPAFGAAFSGKEHVVFDDSKEEKRAMKFANTDYCRYSASANLNIGFEAKSGFFIYSHYSHGLGSMNNSDGGPVIKHRILGLSLGMFLQRNPNVIDTRVRE